MVTPTTQAARHRPESGDLYASQSGVLWLLLEVPADGGPIRVAGLVSDLERCVPARVVAEQWRLVVSGRRLAELAELPDPDQPEVSR